MRRLSDDDKEPDPRADYNFLLIRSVPYVPISRYGKPAPATNFTQPFFVRGILRKEVVMPPYLDTGSLQNVRKDTAKVPVCEKYHTYAAFS